MLYGSNQRLNIHGFSQIPTEIQKLFLRNVFGKRHPLLGNTSQLKVMWVALACLTLPSLNQCPDNCSASAKVELWHFKRRCHSSTIKFSCFHTRIPYPIPIVSCTQCHHYLLTHWEAVIHAPLVVSPKGSTHPGCPFPTNPAPPQRCFQLTYSSRLHS